MALNATIRPQQIERARKLLQDLPENEDRKTRLEAAESSMRAAGEAMGLLMATTVLTGWLMNINPLDQPAVELGKRLAYSRLGSSSYPEEAAILKAFLD